MICKSSDSSYIIVSDKFGVGLSCNALPDSMKVDGLKVSFTAKYIPYCSTFRNGLFCSKYEIVSIVKSDSIFRSGQLIIKIINTSNYGYGAGYGFSLAYQPSNFSIVQKVVPTTFYTPFKTQLDAFKVAILMASKLENSVDFPAVTLPEIIYLQIEL